MHLKTKLKDYQQLIKLRLSLLVVFSAVMAYLWAGNRHVDALTVWLLSAGGLFITASSNILNQLYEKESDKLMKRTGSRPLSAGRMRSREALVLSIILGVAGFSLLYSIHPLCGALGLLALVTYAFIYTPLKKITALTVIPGAVAGSLPVVIGWVAATGEITRPALLLFTVQFVWQFPHTWSIAWLLNDEYKKAGLKMLPGEQKNKSSAALIMLSTFLMIPAGLLLYMYESSGIHVMWMLLLASLVLLVFAWKLYRSQSDRSAVKLMLSCLAYLPFLLFILVIEKFL
jgi:protoheme IX farnesyltransferase